MVNLGVHSEGSMSSETLSCPRQRAEATMATTGSSGYVPNVHHPDIMRGIQAGH